MEITQLCESIIISRSNSYIFVIREICEGEHTLAEPKLKVTP